MAHGSEARAGRLFCAVVVQGTPAALVGAAGSVGTAFYRCACDPYGKCAGQFSAASDAVSSTVPAADTILTFRTSVIPRPERFSWSLSDLRWNESSCHLGEWQKRSEMRNRERWLLDASFCDWLLR